MKEEIATVELTTYVVCIKTFDEAVELMRFVFSLIGWPKGYPVYKTPGYYYIDMPNKKYDIKKFKRDIKSPKYSFDSIEEWRIYATNVVDGIIRDLQIKLAKYTNAKSNIKLLNDNTLSTIQ